jgi:hypothetical protein
MTAYKILLADSLLGMGLVWPEGCSLVRQLDAATAGTRWHEFSDPDAPPELEGREVELTLARVAGKPVITGRRVILVHQMPAGDSDGTLPCCGLPYFEMPRSDTMSAGPGDVTCGAAGGVT